MSPSSMISDPFAAYVARRDEISQYKLCLDALKTELDKVSPSAYTNLVKQLTVVQTELEVWYKDMLEFRHALPGAVVPAPAEFDEKLKREFEYITSKVLKTGQIKFALQTEYQSLLHELHLLDQKPQPSLADLGKMLLAKHALSKLQPKDPDSSPPGSHPALWMPQTPKRLGRAEDKARVVSARQAAIYQV